MVNLKNKGLVMILDYEQKYKEALEKARDMLSYKEVRREDMEYIFPELKESEDERIRKAILEHIQLCSESIPDRDKWIAWLEKQDDQSSNISWHDVSEEPEVQRELFCEWKGYADNIWHDVAFYHLDDKAFWNGERPIPDVIKWAYIDDILKEQPQSQIKPKFKAGDTIQCVSDKTDIRTIAEIDTLYNVYRCENNYPIPFTQENMWKLI